MSPDQISARLNWQYPHAAASRLSAKTSVTEMKRLLALQDGPTLDWVEETRVRREHSLPASQQTGTLALRRPKFMEQSRMSPTERGTVYHTVMQHIPLDAGLVDLRVVEATLQRLVDLAILTSSQAEIVEPEQIASFLTATSERDCSRRSGCRGKCLSATVFRLMRRIKRCLRPSVLTKGTSYR